MVQSNFVIMVTTTVMGRLIIHLNLPILNFVIYGEMIDTDDKHTFRFVIYVRMWNLI